MEPFLVCRFVFSIITGTFYQIVFKMPNRRLLTSDEMHVSIGMLGRGSSQRSVAENLDVSQSVVSRMKNLYQTNGILSIDTVVVMQRPCRPFKIVILVF